MSLSSISSKSPLFDRNTLFLDLEYKNSEKYPRFVDFTEEITGNDLIESQLIQNKTNHRKDKFSNQFLTNIFHRLPRDTLENHYVLGDYIGGGEFSQVFECTCRKTFTKFAVKCINKKSMSNREFESLKQEIAISSSLKHPGICSVREIFETSKASYIIQELAKHGNLHERLKTRTYFMEGQAARTVGRILQALNYLHLNGVVHRDIKLENILCMSVSDDTDVKITDFGFASYETDLMKYEEACGTPEYVAPEVLMGKEYGKAIDVWSLGVVTYALLCGYIPFPQTSIHDLFTSIINAEYHFHADSWRLVSLEAKNFIRCMLEPDPEQRYTTEQLLAHSWIQGHSDDVPQVPPAPKVVRKKMCNESVPKETNILINRKLKGRYHWKNKSINRSLCLPSIFRQAAC